MDNDTSTLMLLLDKHNMTTHDYVYLVPWMLKSVVGENNAWRTGTASDENIFETFQQSFVVSILIVLVSHFDC